MKAVVDTNVIVSAVLKADSTPGKIISSWRHGEYVLVTSDDLLKELTRVLARPRVARRSGYSPDQQSELVRLIRSRGVIVDVASRLSVVAADPDDNRVLEAAVAGGADYIVSGDHHLLDLGEYASIPIVTPARFLAVLAAP